ncbi:hypothetical protein Cabys_3560 [Caldithrix abyssi DSM 13497]|uniref:Uncharacterized protein n=1 Tax=Caldithrix abyssi DSM 13497 TaxID=880073 RepID=A0A1J1CE97_CALAY|nr:hypothetical protein Cabys_3560 [Caldithrix abyssi DSM 13497]
MSLERYFPFKIRASFLQCKKSSNFEPVKNWQSCLFRNKKRGLHLLASF